MELGGHDRSDLRNDAGTHWIGDWLSLRAAPDAVQKRTKLNPDTSRRSDVELSFDLRVRHRVSV